jgi:S1-C subfamily serine protease
MRVSHLLLGVVVLANPAEACDVFSSSTACELEKTHAHIDAMAAESHDKNLREVARITLSSFGAPNAFVPDDPGVLPVFEGASLRYNFFVDVLMAMAEKDSGFNPLARSAEGRGIIKMTDEEVAREGINPYLPDQAINAAAKKMRGYLDSGLSIRDALKAHFAGPNRRGWGAEANAYAGDVLSRTKRLKDTYYPSQSVEQSTPPPSAEPSDPAPPRAELEQSPQANAGAALAPPPDRPRRRDVTPAISAGTGFFVAGDGTIVTNSHVVDDCTSISVRPENEPAISAQLVARDKVQDLALVHADVRPRASARLRSAVRLGESVAVFGFPYVDVLASSGNFTLGNVTALSGFRDDKSQVQISAPVQSGNSGGPLLDTTGNVVGVVVGKLDSLKIAMRDGDLPQNVNFAIKADILMSFLDANHVLYTTSSGILRPLETPDLANSAAAISAFVVCVQK